MRRASPPRQLPSLARTRSGPGRALVLTAGLLAAACAHGGRTAPAAATPAESATFIASIPELKHQPGETVAAYDPGHAGHPTLWKYSVVVGQGQDRVVRRERDLNGDGRVDVWEVLDEDGNVSKAVYDMDFDGKPDLVVTYEKGQLVRKEIAPGFDGMARTVEFYENGKLVRKERDTSGTGKIDTWEYFENGEIDRIGHDDDGDGQVDRWEKREGSDKEGAAAGDSAAPSPAPAPATAKDKPKAK